MMKCIRRRWGVFCLLHKLGGGAGGGGNDDAKSRVEYDRGLGCRTGGHWEVQ